MEPRARMSSAPPLAAGSRAAVRLFCIPYAGGSASPYQPWRKVLPPLIDVDPVSLPGRDARIGEPPLRAMGSAVDALVGELFPRIDRPFVFFGHSMGALLAYEVARRAEEAGLPLVGLLASGAPAPHLHARSRDLHALPDAELVQELRRLGGTPREALENPELMALVLPTLRADFELCETYRHRAGPPLGCPVHVFGGLGDEGVPREDLEAWRALTSASFRLRMLPGGHFFLHESETLLTHMLARDVVELLSQSKHALEMGTALGWGARRNR